MASASEWEMEQNFIMEKQWKSKIQANVKVHNWE